MTNQFQLAVRAGRQAGRTFCSGKLQPVAFIIRSTPAMASSMHPVGHIHMFQDDHASCSHSILNRTDNLINKLQYPSLSLSLSLWYRSVTVGVVSFMAEKTLCTGYFMGLPNAVDGQHCASGHKVFSERFMGHS